MKSPSRNDVTAMADIMKALNGDTTAIKKTATSGSVDSHAGMSNKQQETAAMLKIMNAMNNVDAVSENVAEALYESSKTRTGFKIGAYEISNVSPRTGTVTLKSTIVTEGLFPGIFNPNVLAIDKIDFLSFA